MCSEHRVLQVPALLGNYLLYFKLLFQFLISKIIMVVHVYVCVYTCTHIRERERHRDRNREGERKTKQTQRWGSKTHSYFIKRFSTTLVTFPHVLPFFSARVLGYFYHPNFQCLNMLLFIIFKLYLTHNLSPKFQHYDWFKFIRIINSNKQSMVRCCIMYYNHFIITLFLKIWQSYSFSTVLTQLLLFNSAVD